MSVISSKDIVTLAGKSPAVITQYSTFSVDFIGLKAIFIPGHEEDYHLGIIRNNRSAVIDFTLLVIAVTHK